MSDIENKKTTSKQKVIMVLITIVLLLLVAQAISTGSEANSELPTNREACLEEGFIWSQSSETCYDGSTA